MIDNCHIRIIQEAARAGAAQAMKVLRPADDRISRRQAEAEFGWAWVKRQVDQGSVIPARAGNAKNSTMYFSRAELTTLRMSEIVDSQIVEYDIFKLKKKQ